MAKLAKSLQTWPKESTGLDAFYTHPENTDSWRATNLTKVHVPWTMHGTDNNSITIHHKCADALEEWLNAVAELYGRDQAKLEADGLATFDGSYVYRPNRNNPAKLSLHSYGAAFDIAAARNPNGKAWRDGAGMMPAKVVRLFLDLGGAWGGDFSGTPDPMHFQFTYNPHPVSKIDTAIGGAPDHNTDQPTLQAGSSGDAVRLLQRLLGIEIDGEFGIDTETAVENFQRQHGLAVDGIAGRMTWTALNSQPLPGGTPWRSGKGSWYSQFRGWPKDTKDEAGSNVLGVPDDAQGIALFDQSTKGHWFEVKAPNGTILVGIQSDIGPNPKTGRMIDISAVMADRFGYAAANFPTDSVFQWRPIVTPEALAGLTPKQAAVRFRDLGWKLPPTEPLPPVIPPDVVEPDDPWTWPTGDNLSEILRNVLDKFIHGGINNLKVPIGNPINLFKNAMSLMTLAKSVHPSNVTLEKLSEAGVAGLSVLAEHPVARLQPMITVQPQTKGIPMFGANWKTGSTGLLTILGGVGTLFTAISMKNWNPETYLAALGLIASGLTGLFAKDKNVTGGTTANDPK